MRQLAPTPSFEWSRTAASINGNPYCGSVAKEHLLRRSP
jgi:hypothetical protein